ncbi:MAG: BtrH N-terminal domain-containing protein [bacterium]
MTEKIINNWKHHPGKHCASSALRDLMQFYGYDLTEPECFGIGEGIGFWYIEGLNPSRMMHFRSADIEKRFFNNIGIEFEWDRANSKEEISKTLFESINKDIPVLLRTDIFYLDYYKSKTHFPGHVIILWGYNTDNNIAYISDTERKGLTQCGLDALLEGIMHGNFPEGESPHFKPIEKPVFELHKKKLFTKASTSNASTMLSGMDFDGYGVKGIQLASKKVLDWKELSDWKWLSRFAYQVIEKRGTGGGGFRKMYADFLEMFANKKLVTMMKQIASRWTDIALVFKQISESDRPDFSMVSDMLWIQAIKEEEFYKTIAG